MSLLLIAFLAALLIAVITFAAIGFMQWRRQVGLARKANAGGLRFSVDDPFDIPRRYCELVLMGSGHSLMAHNVTYGHVQGWPMRGFDFHYEVGHGTRRMTRRFSVVLLESPRPAPWLLIWRPSDAWTFPAASDGQIGPFSYIGPRPLASAVIDAGLDCPSGGCFQSRGAVIMLALPRQTRSQTYFDSLPGVMKVARAFLDPVS